MPLTIEVDCKLAHVEVPRDFERSPKIGELAPTLLQLFVVGVGDLRPQTPRRYVDEEPLADALRTNPRHVQPPLPVLPDDVLRELRVLGDAQRRCEIVARPGGQDAKGDSFGETGPAEPVKHVVDRAVPPGDDEQPLAPLLSGPYSILWAFGLDPVDLHPGELVADLIRIVGTTTRGRVADHPCFRLLHGALSIALTTPLVYPENLPFMAASLYGLGQR